MCPVWFCVDYDLAIKTVAALGYSGDPGPASWHFAEDLAQQRDVDSQVGFFHVAVGPHGLHEGFARYEVTVTADESYEQVKGFRCERNRIVFPEKQLLRRIQTKGTELVM